MKLLRSIHKELSSALEKKMVFIGGPRQVGKTTLSLTFLSPPTPQNEAYLNWDRSLDKSIILRGELPLHHKILVLDEVHKFKRWRELLKGLYDKHHETNRFLVTGSARLDYFRKGGDSLLGRYRYFRLHPLSITEINKNPTKNDLDSLLRFGGFPECFTEQNEKHHRIWQKSRLDLVVTQDLRDLENIKEISLVLLLAEALPERVGSPLSLRSIAEDLGVSQPTVDRWIQSLCHLYYCFTIPPYGTPKIRAVKKHQKLYLWDWSAVPGEGPRFENLVASHLLKYCHFIEDTEGHRMELRYLRDTDLREIDFVVLKDRKPLFAVECKTGDGALSPHIKYFRDRTPIPEFYQIHRGTKRFGNPRSGEVLPFLDFYRELCEKVGHFI
ncbi:MAG: ATP-binding protein [Bdellovibrionaceae bacterium]|nr:ATP-binding protein [Pseudobdellovibrionaceae bacterium]